MIRVSTKVTFPAGLLNNVTAGIISLIDRLSTIGQKVAKNEAPKDTGLLFNSIQLIREFNPPRFNGGIQTNVPYAIVMDEVRRPGSRFPPAEPIASVAHRSNALQTSSRTCVVRYSPPRMGGIVSTSVAHSAGDSGATSIFSVDPGM